MRRSSRLALAFAVVFGLGACAGPVVVTPVSTGTGAPQSTVPLQAPEQPGPAAIRAKARSFLRVIDRVEPVAEQECQKWTAGRVNCDFQLVIDDRPGQPPNAFQTEDKAGRPLIGFTPALIVSAQNEDELAFILSHEAAHHIAGHLARTQDNARLGAAVLGGLIGAAGGDAQSVRAAQDLGAAVGGRAYSKDFELEADALGARIAIAAGYDPARGAEFFRRVPDPGDAFLGTHPPNAQRMEVVRRVAEGG